MWEKISLQLSYCIKVLCDASNFGYDWVLCFAMGTLRLRQSVSIMSCLEKGIDVKSQQ